MGTPHMTHLVMNT